MPSSIFQPVEAVSGARKIIDAEHEAIHSGVHFTAYHSVSVGTATAVTVLLSTPSAGSGYIHFSCSAEADKAITWTFSEAPNASGGSSIVGYNNDRNSTIANPVTITHTVTYVSSGTLLEGHLMGTNQPTTRLGGNANIRNEWILKPETLYLLRAVAAAADTQVEFIFPYYYRS